MIGILLNDASYEQDVRELLMAFFPRRTFTHKAQDMPEIAAVGELDEERRHLRFYLAEGADEEAGTRMSCAGQEFCGRIWNPASSPVARGLGNTSLPETENGGAGAEASEERFAPDPVTLPEIEEAIKSDVLLVDYDGDRRETKNRIKRRLYVLLVLYTGKQMPWGALTGIRPTKIALTRLDEGWEEARITRLMREEYYASPEKTALSLEIAKREREMLSELKDPDGYSLYIGIPFCPTTCLYCSFTSYPIAAWQSRTGEYLNALFRELDYVAQKKQGRAPDTVYFGGGTPTSLSAEDLDTLITRLETTFDLSALREFTVEAGRPDSITGEKLAVLKRHGVTRISINPQTMKEETLRLIGRRHTVADVTDRFRLAREMGFDNINMDLIIGLPQEEIEDVRATMEAVRALGPDSLTVHSLAIKRAARLNTKKEDYQDLKITNTQEMIDLTARYARDMGLEPYYLYRQKNMAGNFENVGYAAPGKACLYNVLIMEEKQTIIGCGAGTTTKRIHPQENRIERAETVKAVDQYIARVDEMIARKERVL
ncbi:MAG: coproporphyrinogen dehydrogenase HemZ [Clostridiales bacterium]|nr:coproporphyrinogen dehydrogenase HemZ [Clostridiales bacterium]